MGVHLLIVSVDRVNHYAQHNNGIAKIATFVYRNLDISLYCLKIWLRMITSRRFDLTNEVGAFFCHSARNYPSKKSILIKFKGEVLELLACKRSDASWGS